MVKKCKSVSSAADGVFGKDVKKKATKQVAKTDAMDKKEVEFATDASKSTELAERATDVVADAGGGDAACQKDEVASRRKELGAMAIDALKELVDLLGLERAKKSEMVEDVLAHEKKLREEREQHEMTLRAVVVERQEELASLNISELKARCAAIGIPGTLGTTKQDRVECLLKHWQECGGIDQALAKKRLDARDSELTAMSADKLIELCEKAGVDPLVKEVMVDRVLRRETELGRFAPPAAPAEETRSAEPQREKDLVTTLLANEAARSRQRAEEERQQQQEALVARKKEELGSLTIGDLKRRLSSKGASTSGAKGELVEALLSFLVEEETLAKRKDDLMALGKERLKELVVAKGLAPSGMNKNVEVLLQHEAKCAEELREYKAQVMEQLSAKKEALEAKTGQQLQELCTSKGLSVGTSKEDRVQRLLREANENGEVDQAIRLAKRAARRRDLEAMDKAALRQVSTELEVDPHVKSVIVERLMHHEAEEPVDLKPGGKRQRIA
jgi:hypothetical protein